MRLFFTYFLVLLFQIQVVAQSPFLGLYTNDADEFICFHSDTIWYRINNQDAFKTFSIGKGLYNISDNGKKCILRSNLIKYQTSILKKYPLNDSNLIINVIDSDGTPFPFVDITITNLQDNFSSINLNSDKNGQVSLNRNQISLYNEIKVSISIVTLGFMTEQTLILNRGYNYEIRSIMPRDFPFTINEYKKLRIEIIDTNKIKIEIGNYIKAILFQERDSCSCSELLYKNK